MTIEKGNSTPLDTWASSGTKEAPDADKTATGVHSGERLAFEYFNYLLNIFGQKINHSLLEGIPYHNITAAYEAGAEVKRLVGDKVRFFCAKVPNTNSPPPSAAWAESFGDAAEIEHNPLTGRHRFPRPANQAQRDAITDKEDGMLVFRKDLKIWEAWIDGAWVTDGIPTGFKGFCYNSTAPYGFVQDTTINDRVLRIVGGSGGGGVGGQWAISGLSLATAVSVSTVVNIAGHILSVLEMPIHDHELDIEGGVPASIGTGTFADAKGAGQGPYKNAFPGIRGTYNTGGDQPHGHPGSTATSAASATTSAAHDGTWRPAYLNVMGIIHA